MLLVTSNIAMSPASAERSSAVIVKAEQQLLRSTVLLCRNSMRRIMTSGLSASVSGRRESPSERSKSLITVRKGKMDAKAKNDDRPKSQLDRHRRRLRPRRILHCATGGMEPVCDIHFPDLIPAERRCGGRQHPALVRFRAAGHAPPARLCEPPSGIQH